MIIKTRYGAGEILGRNVASMTQQNRAGLHQELASKPVCPARASCHTFDPNGVPKGGVRCNKPGGICSIRRYQAEFTTNKVGSLLPATIEAVGTFSTICPERFLEGGRVFSWIGLTLLDTEKPRIVRELPFLENAGRSEAESDGEPVGRLDCVLVRPDDAAFNWCAVEMQAVYLSNSKTKHELSHLAASDLSLPFPATNPRPDYRSSGPKRLLPQLQIKVPTLSRWGVKTAVVVDQEFYASLGKMRNANHPSNADIAWFVMRYDEVPGGDLSLREGKVYYTTLGEAIEGLIGAQAIPKTEFEEEIKARLNANYPARVG